MDFDLNVLRRIDEKNSYIVIEEDSMMDPIVKPRKRRLDHLTWEEKIQRKKLKNRVAAQTSRDRKKAKMEQLEVNFERLMAQNQRVLAECENLKKLNDKLRAENKELQQRTMRQPCPNCNHPQAQSRPVECGDYLSGSTARCSNTLSSGSADDGQQQQQRQPANHQPAEDPIGLPNLQDLIDEFQRDADLCDLDELTQSLLADIAANLDAAGEGAKLQDSVGGSSDLGEVVGTPSEQLESDGSDACDLTTPPQISKKEREELAEFLLLHHDYSCKPTSRNARKTTPSPHKKAQSTPTPPATSNNKKLSKILPKQDVRVPPLPSNVKVEPMEVPEAADDEQLLCGFYDESENCITIIVDDDENIDDAIADLQEQIANVASTTTPSLLNVPPPIGMDCGFSSGSSDCGYESLGSPNAFNDDLIDPTMSELFPSLI